VSDPGRKFSVSLSIILLSTSLQISMPLSAQEIENLIVPGLEQSVEILKDRWGISHIYAQTEHDLFFSQGYNAARDRLFQFEIWRAQATGTTAALSGPRAIDRDHGTLWKR